MAYATAGIPVHTGICTCEAGYTGAGCELGPAPATIDDACPQGIAGGNCYACNQGFGPTCIGYHGKETWEKAGMKGKVCCGDMCLTDKDCGQLPRKV